MKLYVAESGSAEVRRAVADVEIVATSRVAYPEARAALARRQRERGLSRPALRRAVSSLDGDFSRFVVVEVLDHVARRAGDLAETRGLRGYDAIHLASALELGLLAGAMPAFLAFDRALAEAAASEGLPDPP